MTSLKEFQKERIMWIDIVKAIAISCIVLGHVINGRNVVWHLIYGFNVPLFILLGGITFSNHEEKFSKFLRKKIYRILIPYYVWGIISIIIYLIFAKHLDGNSSLSISSCILGLIWGNAENGYMRWNTPMWYLPMYFVMQIIGYFLMKSTITLKRRLTVLFCSFFIAWIIYNSRKITNLPFAIETVVYLFPFFILGHVMKEFNQKISNIRYAISCIIGAVMVVVAALCIFNQGNIDYVSDEYRKYPMFFFNASLMSMGIIALVNKKTSGYKCISFIGENTLGIMVLQRFPITFFAYYCPLLNEAHKRGDFSSYVIVSVLSILLCALVCRIVNYIFPWMFGKKMKVT